MSGPASGAEGGARGAGATLEPRDLRRLAFVSDPRLSADGARAWYVRTRIESPEEGPPRYRSEIREADPSGGRAPRTLTSGPDGDRAPRPSPDGRFLAFLSRRGEARGDGSDGLQLCLLPLAGGEARVLTRFAAGVREIAWRPDGRALVIVTAGDGVDPKGDEVVAREVRRLHYKADGTGFRPSAKAGLRLLRLDADGEPDGEPVPLHEADAFGDDASAPAFAPDGRSVWLVASADEAEADEWRGALYRIPLDADGTPAGPPERHWAQGLAPAAPAPSPDGRHVAWLAPSDPDDFASPTGLWVAPIDGRAEGRAAPRLLSGERDAAPSIGGDARYGAYPNGPVWDGADALIANVQTGGSSAPARFALDGSVAPLAGGERAVTAFDAAAGRVLMVFERSDRPGELALLEPDGRERGLTDDNAELRGRFRAAEDAVEFDAGGQTLAYWRLEPAEARADGAIVVQVHGGPHTAYGHGFSFEFQLLAARGYAVVYGNPRGGTGFGAEFATAMLGAYGTVDADDVLAIARHARAARSTPEPPVHLTGGSYGGFMTNWLVGGSDEFRSAVTQRSICNWISFYGASDIGYRFAEREVMGRPWEDLERLWAQSPLSRVASVSTPILVLHADADHRCPVEQAEQWYVALKRIGRAETKLVRFPDEGHELSRSGRPDRRERRLEEIVGWFEAHP